MNHSYSSYIGKPSATSSTGRIISLMIFASVLFIFIILRLFQLQILKHKEYSDIAESQHFGAIDLPAKRGEILVMDSHSGELSKFATNTTLDLLYVDPLVAEDKSIIAKSLAPLLFTKKDYEACTEAPDECHYNVIQDEPLDSFLTTEPVWDLGLEKDVKIEKKDETDANFKAYDEVAKDVEENIFSSISKLEVDFVILKRDAEPDLMANVINERLPGIFVNTETFMIYGDPTLIPETQIDSVSETLAEYIDQPTSTIKKQLTRRKVRYVFLKNKLAPEISKQIRDLSLKGVVLLPEHWRYYPEGPLSSHIIGFINGEGTGQYGIEGYYNIELEGKKGKIYAESDPFGGQITVGESKIVSAVDGDTVVLTIDRIIQKKVEEILAESVESYHADSGQIIIMNPFTGAIISMVNYPSFDPNDYTQVYTLRKLEQGEEIYKTMPVFKKDEKGHYVTAGRDDIENNDIEKFIYENKFGPGVFKNKTVSDYYEPGSIFKPVVMATALDSGEVEPQDTFVDDGPLLIDEFVIENANNAHYGKVTMNQVLEKSINTGMATIAKKLGKRLMYQYIKDFGFGEYTNIPLEGETKGNVDYYTKWSKAQLLTTSFGQGIIVTPLQMITSWSALANGGKLMQPYIIDSVIKGDGVIKTEPQVVHRVISEETSSLITSMLINVVRNGQAKPAGIPGYLIAGKTGTSQIAGPGGKYETGEGSLNTSFVGYFPALKPQYLVFVKFDRPRLGGASTWGETTTAPTFKKVAEFLIDYSNIQPE